jgi:uncharacterized phiE125 gp8 family phage protein
MSLVSSRLQGVQQVSVIVPPDPLLDLDLAKKQLKVEHTAEDDLIQAYIDAALAQLDGPGGWLGRAIAPQTLQLAVFDTTDAIIALPYPPIIEVESVTYDDLEGEAQDLDAADWLYRRGALQAVSGSFPEFGELRVRYRAGYEPPAEDDQEEPSAIKRCRVAALMLVADYFHRREAQLPEPGVMENKAVERLLGDLKIYAIG